MFEIPKWHYYLQKKTFPDHLDWLQWVLIMVAGCCSEAKSKQECLVKKEVQYLGHMVSAAGIKPNPSKTEAVYSYPTPTNVKELQQFSDCQKLLSNHYQEELERVSVDCQNAPDCSNNLPILTFPDFSKEVILHTDTLSGTALGVFCQKNEGAEQCHCILEPSTRLSWVELFHFRTEGINSRQWRLLRSSNSTYVPTYMCIWWETSKVLNHFRCYIKAWNHVTLSDCLR